MNEISKINWNWFILLLAILPAVGVASSYNGDTHKTVDGIDIYIGLIPSEMIQGKMSLREQKMHGGALKASGQYHLVIALFNAETGKRIANAEVTASIAEIGFSGNNKDLELMKMNKVETYGNYFSIPKSKPYRVLLKLKVPGKVVTEVFFESINE